MYKYSFDVKKRIISCEACPIMGEGGECLLLTFVSKNALEQYKNCPLEFRGGRDSG